MPKAYRGEACTSSIVDLQPGRAPDVQSHYVPIEICRHCGGENRIRWHRKALTTRNQQMDVFNAPRGVAACAPHTPPGRSATDAEDLGPISPGVKQVQAPWRETLAPIMLARLVAMRATREILSYLRRHRHDFDALESARRG